MSAATDMAEQQLPRRLAWCEAAAFPLLADHECPGCGYLPGVEVIACTCGQQPLDAGGITAGSTTVTLVSGPVVTLRGRGRR